jgi:dihydrolipoamide dehydrogenase
MQHFELIVIGGGPGGYVAAIRAAQLNKQVALVERERVGGTCLNHGCIPTKTLYRTAEVLTQAQNASRYGVRAENISLDLDAARTRKQKVVDTLVGGVQSLLKSNGVNVISGEASFTDASPLRVGGETFAADAFLTQPGAGRRRCPSKASASTACWTARPHSG